MSGESLIVTKSFAGLLKITHSSKLRAVRPIATVAPVPGTVISKLELGDSEFDPPPKPLLPSPQGRILASF